jgi:hypothetical protein
VYAIKRKRKPKTPEQKFKERIRKQERYHRELKFDGIYKEKIAKATRKWQLKNPEKYMWSRSKQSAIKYNIPFNIEPEDIFIPGVCPIMKVPMVVGTRHTPSVDRIIPELGYTKGNIWVISKIANMMKSNSTPEERVKFSEYYLSSK